MRTPKRINDALNFFEKLIWRHGKCGYKPLLNMACPSKVGLCVPYNGREFISGIQVNGSVQKADILVSFNTVLPFAY